MKRVIIIILLVLSILLGYNLVANGVENKEGDAIVSSYKQVEEDSEDLVSDIASYNTLNNTQYNAMLTSLSTAITKYQEAKEDYEELISELAVEEPTEDGEDIMYVSPLSVYEIDFLWATIGNYAKREGLTITMDVNKSSVSVSDSMGYEYYNLSFSVSGQYIDIANFLYDIEDDERMSFEIRDFYMTSGAATFTIYSVPIDTDTLTNSQNNTIYVDENGVTSNDTTDENSIGNETVTSDNSNITNDTNNTNTTDSTNSTNTTNTVNNTTNQ